MSIADELEVVRKKGGGILRPADVVAFAADPDTELHSRFEWDDTAAAHQYRLEQARLVIRCTVKLVGEDNRPIRAYVSLVDDRTEGDSYREIDDVRKDPEQYELLLAQAKAEAESWRRRYEHLVELGPIVKAIRRVMAGAKDRNGRAVKQKPKPVGGRLARLGAAKSV